jgi:N-carbamoylputrescine amidase
MTTITVAALQLAFTDDVQENIRAVSELVREAAGKGAKLILPPELFEGHYFCRTQDEGYFTRALPVDEHPAVAAMQALAAELQVYIPTSFFEAEGHHHYNSLAMIDDAGAVMGVYRKSHIPDGPGYSRNSTSAPVIPASRPSARPSARLARRCAGIQWYPETARALMLDGAEILLFPTAIGTEPHDPDLDTSRMWRRAMIGHAVSNVVPVVAANRIGRGRRPALLRPQLHLRPAR